MDEIRISLDESQFRDLVAGKIVSVTMATEHHPGTMEKTKVKIALKDIGFDRMAVAVNDAIVGRA